MRRWIDWYKSLRGIRKWSVVVVLNWLYWGFVNGITIFIFRFEMEQSLSYFFYSTTFMAIFWTAVYDAWLGPLIKRKNAKREAKGK